VRRERRRQERQALALVFDQPAPVVDALAGSRDVVRELVAETARSSPPRSRSQSAINLSGCMGLFLANGAFKL
jgi:hypothetical protein